MNWHILLFSHIPTSQRVFWVSILVFSVLNLVENLVHYSIGRNSQDPKMQLTLRKPNRYDFAKIICVMVVFALLQGTLTCLFSGCD